MSQTLNLRANGLYPAPNIFSGAPDGALLQAQDVIIDQQNLPQSRRGFDQLPGTLPVNGDRMNRFGYYQGLTDSQAYIVGHWGTTKFGYYNSGTTTWVPYSGSFPAPDQALARTRFLQQNNNLYFTTSSGIYKLDSVENDTPRTAGVPQGLDVELALTGSSGYFSAEPVGAFVGTLTSGSPIITGLASLPGNIATGQYLSDPSNFIPSGTTVTSIQPSTLAATTTSSSSTADSAAQTTLHVASTSGLAAGQLVSDFTGTLIQAGTTVVSVGSGIVILSLPLKVATVTTAVVTVQFSTAPTITMTANATGGAPTSESITYSAGGQVAYRLLWGYKDANNNVLRGAPTQWSAISNNTGGSRNVIVTSSIPAGITTAYFFEIYRSFQTATISITPSDEMQLCYTGNPVSADFTNGYVQVTDVLIDALLGASLYTSPSQQGIGQAYAPPPMAKDFCSFQGYTFYANTTQQQTINLTILGIGASNGVQVGDTLTIGGIVFTAGNSQNIGTNTFQVVTTGTPAQNITATTNSLIQVINRSATSVVYAYGISGPTSLPGQMLLSSRTFGQAAFVIIASAHGTAYNPALPTSGSTVVSTAISYKNGIFVSVQGQPEAVPIANLLPLVGAAGADILRVIALRDYIVILKTDGIFRIVGNSLSNFQILAFDYTTILVAPDSAVTLNNQVWCIANQGVVSISDSGVQQQSWTNINNIIQDLLSQAPSQVAQYAAGIGYETDHKYILGLPSSSGDTGNTQTYTFNVFTNAWTLWTRQFTVGFIHPTQNLLYLGNFQNNKIVLERKTGTYTDYIDELIASPTIISYVGNNVVLSDITNISFGYLLFQTNLQFSVVTGVNIFTNTVTVQSLVAWTLGAAEIFPCINNIIQWKPLVAGNPGFLRQYGEGDILFNSIRFNTATVSFFTELSQSQDSVTLTGTSVGDWGQFPWGSVPWGGTSAPAPIRFYIPLNDQICGQLNVIFSISQAYSAWAISGVNIVYDDISQELDG